MKLLSDLLNKIEEEDLFERKVELKKNEFIKTSGSVDTNLYFIKKGALVIYTVEKFEEHIVCIGNQEYNDLVLDVQSFFNENPSGYYIQAIRQTELNPISKRTIRMLLNKYPNLNQSWNEFLEKIILIMAQREEEIFKSTPHERYKSLLSCNPQLFQVVPSKYIASYLRMTPETLSRIKKY